ncbi:MAG: hypothetical protein JNK81_17010 [Anaerolineales bacterium]|nr:hypothetical protein [Anaerolineales bacterium]
MHTGLLWFDNDPKTTLSVKIQKAMEYYFKKFGRKPDLCLVHPSMLETNQKQVEFGKLVVRSYRPIMPGHFWVGVEDQKAN